MNHHKKKLVLNEKRDFKETERAHKKKNTLQMNVIYNTGHKNIIKH